MDDFPSNSDRSKEEAKDTSIEAEAPVESKKVIEGPIVRKKKSVGRKFKETFIGGSASTVGEYILYDILIPAIKDTLADITTQGVERILFAEVSSSSRRTARRGRDNYTNYTNYTRRSDHKSAPFDTRKSETRRRPSTKYEFEDIIIPSRAEAEKVIDRLFDIIQKYDAVSVADLYELLGVSGNYMDNKWGWYDINARDLVVRVSQGYLLNLPSPEPLK